MIRSAMLGDLLRRRALGNMRSLSTAYTYAVTGDPHTVLSRTSTKTSATPTGSNVQVSWLAAGVDPVDIAAISGSPSATAFKHASLPAVAGNEGVATVTAVGPDASGIAKGDFVIPIKTGIGTWCESGIVKSSDVIPIPQMRLELAATLSASPFTALRILSDFASLSPGDVILQNAGAGPVGTAVVQIANSLGLKTISLIDTPYSDYAPTVERLKLLGGDVVIGENYVDTNGFRAVMDDLPKPKLVLNGADQASCALLADLSGKDVPFVTYCPGEANEAVISQKGLKKETFSLPSWLDNSSREDVEWMVSTLVNLIEEGKLTAWLQRVKFAELPSALEEGGKIQRKFVAVMGSS